MRLKTQTNLQSGHQRIFLSSTGNIGENIKNIDVKILSSEGEKINLRPTRLVDDRVFRYQDKIFQPMEEFLNDYPMFKKDKNSKNAQGIILPQGKYNFSQTLIVPSTVELAIEPGTTIQLAPKTSILSYAKVIAQGTSSQPITLTSKSGQPWGVFAIVGKHASGTQLNYLVVENGSEDYLNGIYFTGALAVHYAHVTIASSIFRFNSGDDGLNIKHANATLDDNTFTRNQNDGLDLDVVTGQVSGNLFYQNGNDGLDISFSDVSITGNEFIENSDKCLSIGEKSTPNIVNNSFTRCDTAIAVKDLSRALITKNQFLSNDTAISAFQKKLIFGGATVTLDQNEFKDNHVDFDINPNSTLEYADSK